MNFRYDDQLLIKNLEPNQELNSYFEEIIKSDIHIGYLFIF